MRRPCASPCTRRPPARRGPGVPQRRRERRSPPRAARCRAARRHQRRLRALQLRQRRRARRHGRRCRRRVSGATSACRVEFVRVRWPELAAATRRGDFDIAMGGVTMRADRALVGRYTRPYATVGAVALVRERRRASASRLAADLDRPGVRIAVNAGGHLEQRGAGAFSARAHRRRRRQPCRTARLLDRRADAVLTDTAEARDWLRPGLRAIGPFTLRPQGLSAAGRPRRSWPGGSTSGWWRARPTAGWTASACSGSAQTATHGRRRQSGARRRGAGSACASTSCRRWRRPSAPPASRSRTAAQEERRDRARARRSRRSPDHTAAVYRQLIELAKAVQRGAPAPAGRRLARTPCAMRLDGSTRSSCASSTARRRDRSTRGRWHCRARSPRRDWTVPQCSAWPTSSRPAASDCPSRIRSGSSPRASRARSAPPGRQC